MGDYPHTGGKRLMSEVRVNTWEELQGRLFQNSWQPTLKRHRARHVFRGAPDASFALQTSLSQLGGNYEEMEPHLLRNFRKYAHRSIVEQDTSWHWLTLAQHHGLPTRLLDWTVSPYVAAHFATANIADFDRDGAIWAVDHDLTHELAPEALQCELEREGADYFTVDMLAKTVTSLPELDALAPPLFVIFFEPPSIDDRIVNQFALFSVMPDPKAALDDWLRDHPELWYKIVIPAELKWELRDKLDQANITERVLFPGLDGLSQWLKRYYTPRI
jgi:hypothetical protein